MAICIAIDSSVLSSMGDGDRATLVANQKLQDRGYGMVCTNTPLINLAAYAVQDLGVKDAQLRKSAEKALEHRGKTWGIETNLIEGAWSGVALEAALELVKAFPELGLHRALTIAEASLAEADILLSWDPLILKCQANKLLLILRERHLKVIHIFSPATLMATLGE